MALLHLLVVFILILTLIYWFLTRKFNYWKHQNLPFAPNPIPVFGHLWPVITLKEGLAAFAYRIFKSSSASMVGFYFMQTPAVVVRDPELVKSVLQTNFNSFRNNGFGVDEINDPVMAQNPFFTKDPHKWKVTRARSGSHLSGRKLRYLFVIIQEVCSKMSNYVERKINQNNDGIYECELKDHFLKCTGEIVANSAFGIEGQSFEDNPDQLSFTNVAKNLFEPSVINGIKQALVFYIPDVARLFGIGFLGKRVDNYFRENLKVILKQRKQTSNAPNDFLQFCIETSPENDLDSIVADVLIFYTDVYETSSTALSALFYHLSKNKQVQEELRVHILSVLKTSHSCTVSYESLKNMNYLDQVIFEALRLVTPLSVLMKYCTEDITLKGNDGLTCHLQAGHLVFISTMGLHLDSNYWSDPHIFNPERFSQDNQANRNKYTFLAFGEGPRMCIGMRLGLMLVKLATVSLLTRYSIEHSSKTKLPLELEPTSFLTHFKGGLWGKFKKLDQDS